jgi:carbamoyl-phosphate synthase large subunit
MKFNVIVTGVGGRSVGSGILHSLVRSPSVSGSWNVHAADADSFSWGLYHTDKAVTVPFATSPDYLPFILKYVRENDIHAIIPGTEIETETLVKEQHLLPCSLIANKASLMPLMMDKFAAGKKMQELGLDYIETLPLEKWKELASKYGFPLIVKPTRGSGGSRGLHLVADEKEISNLVGSFPPNSAPCVQPYIGSEEEEYTVSVLSDKDGAIIDSIVMKRTLIGLSLLNSRKIGNKNVAISTGYSQGFFVKDREVQDFCEKLASDLGSTGPLNIQLRKSKGKIYVFEIHPRFSGTTPFRADVGFNEPDILLRNHLLGHKFGRLDYQCDVACIRAFEHVVVPINKMIR